MYRGETFSRDELHAAGLRQLQPGHHSLLLKVRELHRGVGEGSMVPALGRLAVGELDPRLRGLELGPGLHRDAQAGLALGLVAVPAPRG
jgi:hypothetical protein